ncbi:hypothetical protein PYW07_005241 [Mythimna separata]|uniref:Peptidase M14 domain-containing protein n=1 Tax=Mythimna separata TaxID=271217 RepID=A0AAD7YE06_MYTSE|nr:hypothetical protein PYW07_005241 [Mythimna separata]
MSKSTKKLVTTYSAATIDNNRPPRVPSETRVEYVPQAIREKNSFGPLSQRYDEYIELYEEGSTDSEISANRRKAHSQERITNSKQTAVFGHELKTPSKPIIHCYNSKDNVSNPVTAKKSAPVKKISFVLPDGKTPWEEERMDWKDYHRLEVIHDFMDDLEANFPSICTTASIGQSVEGRHLKILKISNSHASNVAVWMDAGIHAREWIAPAVNTYIANHISRNFESLPDCMTNKDWYFLPVVNPDGYHYSHTTDRLWRKSRANHDGACTGVDLNRNFGVGWGGRGSSDKPNHAFYRGPYPFSEPESAAMRDVFLKSGIKFKVYITLHSFGQLIIFPYSCTTAMAPDYVQLLEGATVMSKAIYNTNGAIYKVGISRDVMYPSAGTSSDFAHGAANIPFCYLIELRSKIHKFKLPKEEIEDTGREILNSVIALMEFVDTYKYQRSGDNIINTQLKKNESAAESCVFLKSFNKQLKKFEFYNKSNHSFVEKCNSQSDGSYFKLAQASVEKEDFCDGTNDAIWHDNYNRNDKCPIKHKSDFCSDTNDAIWHDNFDRNDKYLIKHNSDFCDDTNDANWPDDLDSNDKGPIDYNLDFCGGINDAIWYNKFDRNNKYPIKHNSVVMPRKTSDKETEPYIKYEEDFKYTNHVPAGKIRLIQYEPFTKQTENYSNPNNENDSSTNESESLVDKDSSFEAQRRFHNHMNKFHNTRSNLLKTGAPVVTNDAEREDRMKLLSNDDIFAGILFFIFRFVQAAYSPIHIWKEERSTMDIMIDASRAVQVAGILSERDIPYTIAIADLTALLEKEQNITINIATNKPKKMDWNNYHTLDTIYAFLDSLQAEYPYLCSVQVIGRSAEGREMKMLIISNGVKTNHGVWMDGAIHAREWISVAVVTYLADRIVRSFNEMPECVTTKDWYILPVLNPDGYVYTHTQDRMWRKNRARYKECVGVDLNRNFSYGFGEKGEEGSSEDPGSLFYRGPKPFSEPETAAVKNAVLGAPTKFKAFLSFHSYGEVIIFPWGYTSEACPDYVDLLEGGTAMAKAIYGTSGHTYKVGSTKDLMYYAAGTSIDWSYAVPNIPYSYMIELRSKTHRFLLPKEEIITTAAELQSGVFRLMAFIDQRCTGTEDCACKK